MGFDVKNLGVVIITAIVTIGGYLLFQPATTPVGSGSPGVVTDGGAGVDSGQVGSNANIIVPDAGVSVNLQVGSSGKYSNRYDIYFKKYSDRFFGMWFDWQWFKAQGIAESSLNPNAQSYCKAQGIMQILPGTHADIIKKYPWIENNIWSPRWNIAAGIAYDRMMWDYWEGKLDCETEWLKFMFGSYNGGHGNVLKSYLMLQRYQAKPLWNNVIVVGRQHVHTWRVDETDVYVKRIFKVKGMM